MKNVYYLPIILWAIWGLVLHSCGEAKFSGKTPEKNAQAVPVEQPQPEPVEPPVQPPPPDETVVQEFLVEVKDVDIFIAIDTSGSMETERIYLEQNMQNFMAQLAAYKISARVTAIGGEFTFPPQEADKFTIVNLPIDSNDAIGVLTSFFAGNVYPLPLRPDSNIEVIIITDDNGEGPGNLAGDFRGPEGREVFVNAIVGLQLGVDANNPECEIAGVGSEYMALAQTTMGSVFNLCLKDWSALFMELSKSITIRTRDFALAAPPDLVKGLQVKVGERDVGAEFISYDAEANSLQISADVAMEPGEKVIITYTPVK